MSSPGFVAGGNINPYRFVVFGSGANNTVIQATGTSAIIAGISSPSPEVAPIPGAATYAATSGNPIQVFGVTEMCELEIASGTTVTAGQRLTSDAAGMGTNATSGQQYGAIALRGNVAAGGFITVQVLTGTA